MCHKRGTTVTGTHDPFPPRCKGVIDSAVVNGSNPHGYDWCVEANPIKLGLCEGECWTDDDCQGDLICSAITSYVCGGVGASGWKYCVSKPSLPLLQNVEALTPLLDVSASNAAGTRCQGDCDSDSQCAGNLVCFHREGASYPFPPRCKGVIDSTTVVNGSNPHGYDWCVEENPIKLGLCEGECWTDDDCQGDLICSASTSYDCRGVGASGWKYCVRG